MSLRSGTHEASAGQRQVSTASNERANREVTGPPIPLLRRWIVLRSVFQPFPMSTGDAPRASPLSWPILSFHDDNSGSRFIASFRPKGSQVFPSSTLHRSIVEQLGDRRWNRSIYNAEKDDRKHPDKEAGQHFVYVEKAALEIRPDHDRRRAGYHSR